MMNSLETQMTSHPLLNERQAAALLGLTIRALQSWRFMGKPPRYVRLGRSIRYMREDIEAFVLAGLSDSVDDAKGSGR